ncbi:hypothetical protein BM1_08713 [Bipolaris maydis]|nr:hypothetical protein BM1_08713 [Bipolaris maydis]
MLKTFEGSTMKEVPENIDKSSQPPPPPYVAKPSALADPPRRRQRRSCDACRRSKRACDAERFADFTGQSCSNCLRKNQACTFNWLKATTNSNQELQRKRTRSGTQSSNDSIEGFTTQHHGFQSNASFEMADRRRRSAKSFGEEGDQEDDSNNPQSEDLDNEMSGSSYAGDLVPVRSRKSYGRSPFLSSSHSQRSSFNERFEDKRMMGEGSFQFKDMLLGERTSRGFVTNGLLRIYNDSMENALSCWLTEHNCPYTLQKHKTSVLSSGRTNREWGSSWGNRMYNRVIQLDRAYNSIRIRALTAEEERTASKALNMAVVAFASQWAQAGDRGSRARSTDYNFSTDEFPESNYFERSMQEGLWHQTSQILHRAAGIDSFRIVFAMIIFSLTQRPLDITRPFPYSMSQLKAKYEYFKSIIQDDESPIFLELALRQMMAQRRSLERAEQTMPRTADGEFQDPLQQEDRDTFNLLYWLGVMFDTLSATISERTVVVDDEDCELPRPKSRKPTPPAAATSASTAWPVIPNMFNTQFHPVPPDATVDAPTVDSGASKDPEDNKVWGDLFMRNPDSQVDPKATRWPCSYKLAASTLSSAAPVKVLLYRRVSQIQTLVSRQASADKLESAINAAFQVYTYWSRTYAPFISDCITHHATLPTRIQSWYILLAGHWHLGVFLLSDLLHTIDTAALSLPNERACRLSSNLVATLRRQNALAVADLSLASIHPATQSEEEFAAAAAAAAAGGVRSEFHFALSEAALLTEPWTIVFVRSLCRAGYILVSIAASTDFTGEEREQARARCGDCIEGLWYLGRKSDMAFLAARCLSSMLDDAVLEMGGRNTTTTTTATTTTEDEDEGGRTSASEKSPATGSAGAAPMMTTAPTADSATSLFQNWGIDDIMRDVHPQNLAGAPPQPLPTGQHQRQQQLNFPLPLPHPPPAPPSNYQGSATSYPDSEAQLPLPDGDILDFQAPLDLDASNVWDFNMQS